MTPRTPQKEEQSSAQASSEGPLLLVVHFAEVKDPRRHQHKVEYPLPLLLLIVVGGMLSGFKSWEEFADFAEEKREWLKGLVPYEAEGTPSADTLKRVFERLEPEAFQECLEKWAREVATQLGPHGVGEGPSHVALDGKSLSGARVPGAPTSPLHLLHAYCVDEQLLLGLERAAGAPGEPEAALQVLRLLEVRGTVVTADANLMTKKVADTLVQRQGHYLLALRGNRGPQHAEVEKGVRERLGEVGQTPREAAPVHTSEDGHGRHEERQAWAFAAHAFPTLTHYLPHAQAVLCLERLRQVTGQKPCVERAFYVSDLPPDAHALAARVRAHWEVENQLHRALDVLLHEDAVQVRSGPAALNLAVVRLRRAPS